MDFLSQYENLELITGGDTKTFRAWQKSSRRPVLLHQLSSNPKSGRQLHLLAMLLRHSSMRPSSAPNPILGIEEEGDSVWVITEDVPEMTSLTAWMERADAAKSTEARPAADPAPDMGKTAALTAPVPGAAGPAASLDGKTVLFATRLAAADSSPIVDVDATMFTAPAVRESEPPSQKLTGDETRSFPAPLTAPPTEAESTLILKKPASGLAAIPPDAARVMPSPPLAPPSAGESTAVFQTPAAAQPSFSPPSQPAAERPFDPSEAPGEFTMLFRKPPAAMAEGEQKPRFMGFTAPGQEKARFIEAADASSARPLLDEPAPSSNVLQPAGNFVFRPPETGAPEPTKFFELPDFPSAPGGEPSASQPGEFTQVFQRPPASSETHETQEPGAFTRIFQIPVGSDLLSEAESNTIFSRPAAPASPPAEPQFSAPAPPELKAGPAPAATPATPAVPSFKPPAVPSIGALKSPAIPGIPPLPKAPVPAGGGKAPGLAIPKIPATPKMPAAPKLPKVPGAATAEKAAGAAGPSALPLILIFGGIVLVAVLTVLFFLTRR